MVPARDHHVRYPPWGAWTRENKWLQLGIVMLDTPLGGLFCELVGSPDPVISRGFRTKRAAPYFLLRKVVVCGPRYLPRIRDGGATFLERAREKRTS